MESKICKSDNKKSGSCKKKPSPKKRVNKSRKGWGLSYGY